MFFISLKVVESCPIGPSEFLESDCSDARKPNKGRIRSREEFDDADCKEDVGSVVVAVGSVVVAVACGLSGAWVGTRIAGAVYERRQGQLIGMIS